MSGRVGEGPLRLLFSKRRGRRNYPRRGEGTWPCRGEEGGAQTKTFGEGP